MRLSGCGLPCSVFVLAFQGTLIAVCVRSAPLAAGIGSAPAAAMPRRTPKSQPTGSRSDTSRTQMTKCQTLGDYFSSTAVANGEIKS